MNKIELDGAQPAPKNRRGRPHKTVTDILESAEKRLIEAVLADALAGDAESRRALRERLAARRAAAANGN